MSDGPEDRKVRAALLPLLAVALSGVLAVGIVAAVMHFATR